MRESLKVKSRFDNKKKKKSGILNLIVIIIAVGFGGFVMMTQEEDTDANVSTGESISMYVVDVGQGDSILIQDDDTNILIDTGSDISKNEIIRFLDAKRIETIDYLILTHPHEDHIGKASEIMEEFQVELIYMPEIAEQHTPTTVVYEKLLEDIIEQDTDVISPKTGDIIENDTFQLKFIVPDYQGDNMNNYSLLAEVTYGDTKFLFTGDIESDMEVQMLEEFDDIDFLKVAHHGSGGSSAIEFLDVVRPEYGVLSYGEGNKYDHPHDDALQRLKTVGCEVFSTAQVGTVYIYTDGEKITINGERG